MKRFLIIIVTCMLPLFLMAQTGKELYDMSVNYYKGTGGVKKDIKKGRKFRMRAAKAGYAQAEYDIGLRYYNGRIEKRDYSKALEWFQKAADQGYADAIYRIAYMYEWGKGVQENKQKALDMYLSIAEKGHKNAIKSLASLYRSYFIQPEKELEWWKRGAEFGHGIFMYELAKYYEKEKDYVKSEEWYTKALEKEDDFDKDEIYNVKSGLHRVQNIRKNTAVDLRQQKEKKSIAIARIGSDVDKDIPQARQAQEKTFALIIANENYEVVPSVPYASNDGATVEEYCRQALGIPGDNIRTLKDATYGQMKRGVAWLKDYMKAYQGKASVIIYYAGHGIPDEKDRTGYLLPTDGNAMNVSTAYALDDLYKELRVDGAKSVVILLDACFSGMKREGSMLTSARGIAIKVKQSAPEGNLVVFSAAHGDETAYVYDEQRHGLFTYYLLKSLKEADSSLTLGELADYVTEKVMQQSVKMNSRMQTPTVITSPAIEKSWKSIAIK